MDSIQVICDSLPNLLLAKNDAGVWLASDILGLNLDAIAADESIG